MSLWVDKHRPTSLQKLSLHVEVTNKLRSLAASAELPHLLFYGPPGAGKKTRVMALLREIYGVGVERVRLEHQMFKTSSGKSIEIITLGSNYHVECNPSDAGTNDRFVIQEVIKEIASHSNLATVGSNANKAFKIVLLTEVDRLSKQAQAGLRRTMEKYSSQCRIILLCNSPSKIIEPVRSRCLGIRIPAPKPEDIAEILISTAKREGCVCPYDLAMKISLSCDRNLRRALLMSAQRPDWELYIGRIARDILQEQSPSRLLQVRDMLYELLTNCIPADVILSNLSKELMKCLDDTLKHEVSYWVAYYDHRLSLGAKHIFHLEAFVAKFMSVYKRWLISFFG